MISGGTDVSPDIATNATKGSHCHVSVSAIVAMAAFASPSQLIGLTPMSPSAQLNNPKSRL